MNSCISTCVDLIDRLGLVCATLNKSGFLFSTSNVIDLKHQANYVHLSESSQPGMPEMTDEENMMDSPIDKESFRTVKQKSHLWYQVRSKATFTGSTLYAALGLDTLKKQTEQFDFARLIKQKSQEVNEDVRQRMALGIDNEINTVSTLVSKFLPVFYPDLLFVEDGFYWATHNAESLVFSPDGSCCTTDLVPKLWIEIKCPFPTDDNTYKKNSSILLCSKVLCYSDPVRNVCSKDRKKCCLFVTQRKQPLSCWSTLIRIYGVKLWMK